MPEFLKSTLDELDFWCHTTAVGSEFFGALRVTHALLPNLSPVQSTIITNRMGSIADNLPVVMDTGL